MSRATTGPHPTGYPASVTSTTTRVVGRRDGWIGRRGIERLPRTSDGGRASDRHDRGAGVGRPDCAASRATTFGSRRRVRVEAPPSGRGAAFWLWRRSSRGTARISAHAMFGAVHRPPDPILAAVTSPGDIWADSGRKTASSSSWPRRVSPGVISGPIPACERGVSRSSSQSNRNAGGPRAVPEDPPKRIRIEADRPVDTGTLSACTASSAGGHRKRRFRDAERIGAV